jgi:Fuc2NAc and GlcNAc transferase
MSWVLTGLLRRYAMTKKLLDIPNERSSHLVPTPRGGGLAMVVSFITSILVLWWLGSGGANLDVEVTSSFHGVVASSLLFGIDTPLLLALLGAGGCVAVIGFLDDHGHIPARWRLLAHFISALWALFWLGGLPPLPIFGVMIDLGWLGHILAAVYLVWLLNLYNFMDGIDGIAGIEAMTVCLAGVVLYLLSPSNGGSMWVLPMLLFSSVVGFLIWNFSPAKIFMGDVGSGFLGLMLGSLQIQAAWNNPNLFWAWLILLGMFVVDATVTLIRRILRGEKFYKAHRSHAYQYAACRFSSHKIVSLAFGVINIFLLLPVAMLVTLGKLDGVVGLLVTYIPLVMLALYFSAGMSETSRLLK